MPLTSVEAAVLAAIDADALLADLTELVGIPSVGGSAAERDAQEWCVARLRGLDMAVDRWEIDVDALRAQADFPGMEVARDQAVGCVGVLGGATDQTPAVALYGHTDVVPTGDLRGWRGIPSRYEWRTGSPGAEARAT